MQARSLQLASIIKEAGGDKTEKVPQEVQRKMEELERENTGLRKCVDELREQMQAIRQRYTSEDFEDGKKIRNMEREINIFKEKERIRKEIEEMRLEKNKKVQVQKRDQNSVGMRTTRVMEEQKKIRKELFSPSLVPGPSGVTRIPARAKGPAEEYEEESGDVLKMGKWDYVGGGGARRRSNERRKDMEDVDETRRTDYERYRKISDRMERRDRDQPRK